MVDTCCQYSWIVAESSNIMVWIQAPKKMVVPKKAVNYQEDKVGVLAPAPGVCAVSFCLCACSDILERPFYLFCTRL